MGAVKEEKINEEKDVIMSLIEENRNLKTEIRELRDRLRWIESLSKGMIENDLLRKIRGKSDESKSRK